MKKVVKKTKKEIVIKTEKELPKEDSEEEFDLEVEKRQVLKSMKRKLSDSEWEEEDQESESEDQEEVPEIKTGKKRMPKEKLSKAEKPEKQKPKKKEKKPLLDPEFNLDRDYFYQTLSENEKKEISENIKNYLSSNDSNVDLNSFFSRFANLSKSKENLDFIQHQIKNFIPSIGATPEILTRIQTLNNFLTSNFFTYKPTVLEVYYFPEPANEVKVANMIRTAKTKLDIAIFTLTNDRIYAAIEEVFKRGVPVRLIADDEMAKCMGADVNKVALLGVPVKLDSHVKYHMHNKYAVIDSSVVITGSFNWTTQAVQHNQENVMFFENKEIARLYAENFEKLWNSFTNVVTKEIALKNIEEEEKRKKEMQAKAQETRKLKKELEKANKEK